MQGKPSLSLSMAIYGRIAEATLMSEISLSNNETKFALLQHARRMYDREK